MNSSVSSDQAVCTEVLVILQIIASEISTISPKRSAISGRSFHALVDPIPNKTTLHFFIAHYDIPVLLEVAIAVSHRMRIFTHNERPLLSGSGIRLNVTNRRIHGANQLGVPI